MARDTLSCFIRSAITCGDPGCQYELGGAAHYYASCTLTLIDLTPTLTSSGKKINICATGTAGEIDDNGMRAVCCQEACLFSWIVLSRYQHSQIILPGVLPEAVPEDVLCDLYFLLWGGGGQARELRSSSSALISNKVASHLILGSLGL